MKFIRIKGNGGTKMSMYGKVISVITKVKMEEDLTNEEVTLLMAVCRIMFNCCNLHVIIDDGNFNLAEQSYFRLIENDPRAIEGLDVLDIKCVKVVLEFILDELGSFDCWGYLTQTQEDFIHRSEDYYFKLRELIIDNKHTIKRFDHISEYHNYISNSMKKNQ